MTYKHVFVVETSMSISEGIDNESTQDVIVKAITELVGRGNIIVCSEVNQPGNTKLHIPNDQE